MIIVILTQNIKTERVTWNAVTSFVDVVRDKGVLVPSDYEEFVYKLGATTVDYDITISVQRRLVVPGEEDEYEIRYATAGLWKSENGGVLAETRLQAGDSVQVLLDPLSQPLADSVLSNVLGLHINRGTVSYAANVRNDG